MSGIRDLRKAGRLEEALELGVKQLATDQDNIWLKRDLSWVYYDLMKRHVAHAERVSFLQHARSLADLGLGGDEAMLMENTAFQFVKILFDLARHEIKDTAFVDEAFTLSRRLPVPKGTDAHGALVNAFIKHADHWHHITELLLWADIEALPAKCFHPEEFNGTTIPALVERACIAAGKELLREHRPGQAFSGEREAQLSALIPVLERLVQGHSDLGYVLYYLAKLLHAKGDDEAALARLLPFARKKAREFWVWQLMAHLRQGDAHDQIACLCKALTCKTKGEFLVKVRDELAALLIKQQLFNEARTEIDMSIEERTQHGWPLGRHLDEWTREPWYAQATRLPNNDGFYRSRQDRAEEILLLDQPYRTAIVGSVNAERRMVYYHTSPSTGGNFPLRAGDAPLNVGDVIDIKTVEVKGKTGPYEKVLLHRPSDKAGIPGLTVEFTGVMHVKQDRNGNTIGFVKQTGAGQRMTARQAPPPKDVFVPPHVIAPMGLPGQGPFTVRGKAMLLPKRQKDAQQSPPAELGPVAYVIVIE